MSKTHELKYILSISKQFWMGKRHSKSEKMIEISRLETALF